MSPRCVQVYKFLYATRLLDCGLASQAFHYCEVVGQAVLRQREPFFVLTGEVVKVLTSLYRHTPVTYVSAEAVIDAFSAAAVRQAETLRESVH